MAKYVATPIGSGFGAQSNLNQNFEDIEDNFQRVLYRDGSSPNQMEANIDMNSNTIYNAASVSAASMTINGQLVVANQTFVTELPDPVGQDGKFIKSDGAAASWQNILDTDVNVTTKFSVVVSTVAEMKALTGLVDGAVIFVKERTAGSGVALPPFEYDSASAATVDNGLVYQPDTLSGRFLAKVKDGVVRDEWFGSLYDDSTDNTAAIEAVANSGYKWVIIGNGKGDWGRCNDVDIPAGVNVFFSGCKLRRANATNAPIIEFASDSLLLGDLELDGVKGTYTGSSNHGLRLGANCVSEAKITSHDNYKHGIQVIGDRTIISGRAVCYDNGTNPGPLGTGDGIYHVNVDYCEVRNAYCYNNARIGITVTTFDGVTIDETLSTDCRVENCECTGNSYLDYDFEGVTRIKAKGLHGYTVYSQESVEGTFEDIECGIFSGANHDRIKVRDIQLRPTGTVSEVFAVSGNSPDIDGVYMYDTASSYGTSNTFIVDSSTGSGFDSRANVRNVTVEKGYNALVVNGCQNLSGCAAITSLNRSLSIDGRRVASSVDRQRSVIIRGGVMTAYSTLTGDPSANGFSGTPIQGDTVFREDLVEAGVAPNKYIIIGYTYSAGAWFQMRTLTGN